MSTDERIAANAALLRLFKNEYRESADRHSDVLFVRDYFGTFEMQTAKLRAALERRNKDASVLRKLHEEHLAPAINMELIQAEDAADALLAE
jgi:hypothetical protein